MTTASLVYVSTTTLTATLAGLASDTGLLIGRESTAVDNTATLAIDYGIGGKITLGTTPTASRQIGLFLYGSYDGVSYTGGATGSDAGLTLVAGNLQMLRLLTWINTGSVSDTLYTWGPYSVAQAFGVVPKKFGLWVVHNTGVNLNATGGNHEVKAEAYKFDSA